MMYGKSQITYIIAVSIIFPKFTGKGKFPMKEQIVKQNLPFTIHTNRTIMFEELRLLISHGIFDKDEVMKLNVLKKKTRINLFRTVELLSRLYEFDKQSELWKVFVFLWNLTEDSNRRSMTLLFAVRNDEVLKVSVPVVLSTSIGKKVQITAIQSAIEKDFSALYSTNTLISTSQNIASSWKQAGYIEGKIRSIRVAIKPDYVTVLFALYLGRLDGLVGEDLMTTTWIKMLELPESKLKSLISEAAMRDLITYHHTGGVVAIRFDNLLNQIK